MSPVTPNWSRGPTEKLRLKNLSTFRFIANAVPSGVLPRNPTAAPPVQAPAAGSVASPSRAPPRTINPTVTAATSVNLTIVLSDLVAFMLIEPIVRRAGGSAAENSASRHRSGQPGLRVLESAILTREHRRVSRRPLRGKALDERIVVRMIEERDRESWAAPAVPERRVHHAMQVGQPAIVRPSHEQIADVDDEGRGRRRHVEPAAVARPDLQSARHVLAAQDREAAVIGVGARAELARARGHGLAGVIVQPHRPDGPVDL